MKTYWDSSALIDVILNKPSARARFDDQPQKFTRCHSLAESFSYLTGGRLGRRIPSEDACEVLHKFSEEMTIVSLDKKETLDALRQAKERGVRGGAVHDFLHAYAAELHGCKKIFTGNVSDFVAVTDLEVAQP